MKKPLCEILDIQPRRGHGDISDLKKSIRQVGLINPLTVDEEGHLLAGRRRFQAIMELGWTKAEVNVLITGGDPLRNFRVALDENLKRKQLTDPEVAVAIKEYDALKRQLEGESKAGGDRQSIGHSVADAWSQSKTAEDLGISRQAVGKAIEIARAIEEYPDLASLPSGKQLLRQLRRRRVMARRKEASQAIVGNPSQVFVGDMAKLSKQLVDSSIDMVFTDPPYAEEFLPLFRMLSEVAARVLRPGGICLVYSGQIFLPRVMSALSEHLEYFWTCAIWHSGGIQRIFKANVNTAWKPLLWYVKPPAEVYWDSFIDTTSGGREKDLHDWQQSEAEAAYFIKHLCPPNGIMFDPFCGSGSSLVAAKKLGRRYIGYEIDTEKARAAQKRLDDTPTL